MALPINQAGAQMFSAIEPFCGVGLKWGTKHPNAFTLARVSLLWQLGCCSRCLMLQGGGRECQVTHTVFLVLFEPKLESL